MPVGRAFTQVAVLIGLVVTATPLWPQQISKFDRDRAQGVLQVVAGEVRRPRNCAV